MLGSSTSSEGESSSESPAPNPVSAANTSRGKKRRETPTTSKNLNESSKRARLNTTEATVPDTENSYVFPIEMEMEMEIDNYHNQNPQTTESPKNSNNNTTTTSLNLEQMFADEQDVNMEERPTTSKGSRSSPTKRRSRAAGQARLHKLENFVNRRSIESGSVNLLRQEDQDAVLDLLDDEIQILLEQSNLAASQMLAVRRSERLRVKRLDHLQVRKIQVSLAIRMQRQEAEYAQQETPHPSFTGNVDNVTVRRKGGNRGRR